MNPEFEQHLHETVHHALSELPDVKAPATLTVRVMAAVAARQPKNARARGWQTWSLGWRLFSLAVLLVLFAGVCLGFQLASGAAPAAWLSFRHAATVTELGALAKGLSVLGEAMGTAAKSLGLWFYVGCFGGVSLLVSLCVGLASVYVRVGFSGKEILWKKY